MTKIIQILILGLLAACSSTPTPRLPQALAQAQNEDKEARKALRGGDLLRAQHGFAKALQMQQSLDDAAGAATTIINLATVLHQQHDEEGALNWLDKIVLETEVIYPLDSKGAAAFRKAVILTNLARLPEAEATLTLADKWCEKKCALQFGIDGLRARLLLLNGDAQGALVLANALSKADEADKEEQANALRTAAAAEEKLERYADALLHFQNALGIDKALGLGARIGEDLSGMARVSKLLGHDQEARAYTRRAELVIESLHQRATPLVK
jgi:tetratricopeptide (TPR) repeat protein